jgi:hypothetical protein
VRRGRRSTATRAGARMSTFDLLVGSPATEAFAGRFPDNPPAVVEEAAAMKMGRPL